MKHDPLVSGTRKSVNLSLDTGIVAAAREVGLNLSKISEAALREATRQEHDAAWKREYQAWIAAHAKWVDENDLPLERHRLF